MLAKYKRFIFSPQKRVRILTLISIFLFIAVVGSAIVTTAVFAYFSLNLPDPGKVIRRDGLSTIVYDRNGKVLYDLYNKEHRIPLDLNDIPLPLREATVAIEDKDFYKHQGFDPVGFLRIARNLVVYRSLTGGSTLTQQLVKNVLLTSERTLPRKIKEIILSNQIENRFSKDQILQMYLNEAPYGGATYGVESASQTYFGKSAKELDLIESAIIAGLPQQPTRFSPKGAHPTDYVGRTKDVLRRMREDNYITIQQEHDALKQLPYNNFSSQSGLIRAPHFVFFVKDQLVERFGEQMVESGGLRVTTSLDLDIQDQVQKIVSDEIKKIKSYKVGNGAAVVINPQNGNILSMVGSYDYFDKDYGSFNVATAARQPGSSGKPFVFATALSRGYTPSTMLMDVKTDYPSGDPTNPTYAPENYDGKYRGPMQLRFALGNSTNTIAVKLTALIGVKDIMTNGYNAGISTWEPTQDNMKRVGLSLALGGREVKLLELTSAYSSFAAQGVHNEPVSILKVTDSKGKILYEQHPIPGRRVFSPEVSFLISHILSDNNARKDVFGENSLLVIPGKTVAVKTGTTDLKRDNWTIGYTPSIVTGVWVGNNDNTIMDPRITSGVTGAAPIWNKIMKTLLKDKPSEDFVKPDSVFALSIDSLAGGLPHASDATRSEYFIKGTEPAGIGQIYKNIRTSRSNGKLANDLEIKSGQYDQKEYILISETDPVTQDGKNHWQEAIDKWILENRKDDNLFHPPTEKSDAKLNEVVVNVETPKDHERLDGSNTISVKAKAYSMRDIVKFTVSVDGNEKANKGSDTLDEQISGLSNDKHEIKFRAVDSGGNSGEATIKIGINVPWDYSGSSSPSASLNNLLTLNSGF